MILLEQRLVKKASSSKSVPKIKNEPTPFTPGEVIDLT